MWHHCSVLEVDFLFPAALHDRKRCLSLQQACISQEHEPHLLCASLPRRVLRLCGCMHGNTSAVLLHVAESAAPQLWAFLQMVASCKTAVLACCELSPARLLWSWWHQARELLAL